MMVWIAVTAMSLAAIVAVLYPLLKRRGQEADYADYDIEVYKDQFDQVSQDYDRGLLTGEQAQSAKTEISRRILLADRRRGIVPQSDSNAINRGVAVLLAIAIPAAALGYYAFHGAPDLPGQPFAERPVAPSQTQTASSENATSLESAATTLANRLEKEPGDANGWILLARTYMSINRFQDAADAFGKALELDTENPDLVSAYGESLFMAAQSVVTPASRAAFQETLRRKPGDPRARFYLALADDQAGRRKEALDQWIGLLTESPADAPWVPAVRDRIRITAEALGLDVAKITPEPQAPDSGPLQAPTKAQMADMVNLPPEERQAMINNMVEGLAQRLKDNPRDFAGWQRLIRAYSVQDRNEDAVSALSEARKHFAAAPFPMQQLAELARELNLESAAQPAEAPRGPSREQMAEAQNMAPEDRQAMIEGMVAQLAERLKENPDDVAGWTRLAQSYGVLQQPEKAQDALAQATRVAPENVDLLILYGRTIRSANGDKSTTESLAAMRKVLALAPANMEALWFVGDAEAAAGNKDVAKAMWGKIVPQLPEGSRERAQVQQRIDALEK